MPTNNLIVLLYFCNIFAAQESGWQLHWYQCDRPKGPQRIAILMTKHFALNTVEGQKKRKHRANELGELVDFLCNFYGKYDYINSRKAP